MHIVYICNEYPPAKLVGGIGIFVKNISGAIVKSGHNVTVIGLYSQETDSDELDESGVRIIRIAEKSNRFKIGWLLQRKRLFAKLTDLHKNFPISIIETSDFDAGFFLMPEIDVPKIVRLNGGETYFRTILQEKLKWKHRFMESQSFKKADLIASVSNYTWAKTKEIFTLPASLKPVILPNPVDTNFFSPLTGTIISGRIVYSGTFIRKKGVVDLFKALPVVFEKVPHAQLICVGQDSKDIATQNASTKNLVLSELPVKYHSKVTFAGKIPHADVVKFLHTAEVCVYPSYLEAFPNAWIEAMACGKAIVASNTGSGAEVVEDGISGLLCHPSDHAGIAERIISILSDQYLCLQLGNAARNRIVENFSMNILLHKNLDWYQSVIDQKSNS